jgi:hypothetical protein
MGDVVCFELQPFAFIGGSHNAAQSILDLVENQLDIVIAE